MDFIDLNKACPKDNFPLPKIDQLVNLTSHNLFNFEDTFLGKKQIPMCKRDEKHITFITNEGFYYYKM